MSFQKKTAGAASLAQQIADRLSPQSAGGLQFTLTAGGLPPHTFVVAGFTLHEALSTPFTLTVSLASADPAIDFAAVLDKSATLTILRAGNVERAVTGMVASFVQGNTGKHQTRYDMTIRPDMWRATLRQNARIFQQQDIKTILTTLLKENGVRDVAFSLRNPHPEREFCVQYRETDFDFLQRLTAEEGIFYFFEFTGHKNTLVFADDAGAVVNGPVLPYHPDDAEQAQQLCITRLTRQAQVRPAVVELKDYTFKNPAWAAEFRHQMREQNLQHTGYEHFDFPGRFKDTQHGADFARYRLEALRNNALTGDGESNAATMQPGVLFTLTGHPRPDLNRCWQLVGVTHHGSQPQALEQAAGESGTTLRNDFTFIADHQHWRPAPLPKPAMEGPQIANVVGPAGEEIYCDAYGRVRLQFLWDRYGRSNDHSSCWIRVTQPWAGPVFPTQIF